MRTLLFASTALVALGGYAMAADIPARQPIVKAPMVTAVPYFNWTGCYIGGHIGGGWGRKDFSNDTSALFIPSGQTIGVDTSGVLGGGQIGCDYQFASSWVLGVAGDFSWADVKGNTSDPFFANKNVAAKTEWLATVTGRLGYSWDRWMIYGVGGGAWARDRYNATFTSSPGDFQGRETRSGWVAGVGLEWAVTNNWSTKIEYNHYDFGTKTVDLTEPSLGTFSSDIKQRVDAVKVGINYRFGAGKAPIVARY
jgi:outer membrane immunogenic protein